MPSRYTNPKCPACGRCIDAHYNEDFDEYYCPSKGCQKYWDADEVAP